MRAVFLVVLACLIAVPVMAEPKLVASYDHYFTPNSSNNYGDAWGGTIGLQHDLAKNLKGIVYGSHITDVDFPVVDDPKGSFGELRGFGAGYDLKYELPVNEQLVPYVVGGATYYWWEFRENPFLQDNNVTVDVDPSLAFKIGGGLDINLDNDWTGMIEGGWFDTDIDKLAMDDRGQNWNILDSSDSIGLQYVYVKAGFKKRF